MVPIDLSDSGSESEGQLSSSRTRMEKHRATNSTEKGRTQLGSKAVMITSNGDSAYLPSSLVTTSAMKGSDDDQQHESAGEPSSSGPRMEKHGVRKNMQKGCTDAWDAGDAGTACTKRSRVCVGPCVFCLEERCGFLIRHRGACACALCARNKAKKKKKGAPCEAWCKENEDLEIKMCHYEDCVGCTEPEGEQQHESEGQPSSSGPRMEKHGATKSTEKECTQRGSKSVMITSKGDAAYLPRSLVTTSANKNEQQHEMEGDPSSSGQMMENHWARKSM